MRTKTAVLPGLGLICFGALAQSGGETPRNVFGQPDLTGTWDNGSGIDFVRPVRDGQSICFSGCDDLSPAAEAPSSPPPPPDRPRYKPEFQARVDLLNERQVEFDPVLRCMAPGVPRIGPPDKIVQQANEVIFLYDDVSGSFFRVVPTDGRGHREDVEPSYLGDAIGRYEGDVLVVETINFNGLAWLTDDGSFHTEELRVVERISREGDTLHWEATAYDPAVLAEPWELRPRAASLTDREIVEGAPCIDRDIDHIVDGSHHDNPR
jgi:hypothetical protein